MAKPNWEKKTRNYKISTKREGVYPRTQLFESRGTNTIIQRFYVPLKQQLNLLCMLEPQNEFYKSLFNYSLNRKLTKKQLDIVSKHFASKIHWNQKHY